MITTTRIHRRVVAMSLAAVSAISMLTACGQAGQDDGADARDCSGTVDDFASLVIIVPVHRGAAAPSVPSSWGCVLRVALERGAPVSVVTSEGRPRVALRHFTAAITGVNAYAHHDDLVAAENRVIDAATSSSASSDGNDFWAALTVGADLGAAYPGPVWILSLEPGLSDGGVIDMSVPGMSASDAGEVARYVRRRTACGRLANALVELDGLGYGVSPQPDLPVQQRENITAIWETALKACGAQVKSISTPPSGHPISTSYVVDPVSVTVFPAFAVSDRPIVMDNASPLGFVPDTATFRDPEEAEAALQHIANDLREHPYTTVTITGSTAMGPTAWPSLVDLGMARAEACKAALVDLGVARGRIQNKGVGYRADPPGDSPAAAALNRKVTFAFAEA